MARSIVQVCMCVCGFGVESCVKLTRMVLDYLGVQEVDRILGDLMGEFDRGVD